MFRRPKGSLLYTKKIKEDIRRYLFFLQKSVLSQEKPLKVVLHRAGSYQEYPKSLKKKRFTNKSDGNKLKNIIELMEFSFADIKAHGIEIDVRTVPTSDSFKRVYVVHDAVKEQELNVDAKKYLETNCLHRILVYFLSQDLRRKNHSEPCDLAVFIDLKVPKREFRLDSYPLNKDEREYLEKVISEVDFSLESAVKQRISGLFKNKQIAFVSFNFDALEFVKNLSVKKGHNDRTFYFILGTNRGFFGRMAAAFIYREINYLTSVLIDKIRNAEWLTGIWFDPSGIKKITETLNEMNRDRKFPLDIYLSTYRLKEKKFRKIFEREKELHGKNHSWPLKNVKGLIFDIAKF
jgi:hypothetical protein